MTSSTSTKKITTAQSSMSQNSTMMHQTSSSLMQQTSAASKTTSNEALTTSNEFVTHGQGKFNISNALKKTSHHNSQEDVNSNRIRSLKENCQKISLPFNHIAQTSTHYRY